MTAATARRRQYTPEEFLVLEDAQGFELNCGELEERNVSVLSSAVAVELASLLWHFVRSDARGLVLGPDVGLQIFKRRPNRIPRPDVAFLAADRVTSEVRKSGFLKVAPDLIAEVVSPGDTAGAIQKKVDEYLDAGVRLVWVVYPETQKVIVYRLDGTTSIVGPKAQLDGEDVLPGFSVPVADLFPEALPAAATE